MVTCLPTEKHVHNMYITHRPSLFAGFQIGSLMEGCGKPCWHQEPSIWRRRPNRANHLFNNWTL